MTILDNYWVSKHYRPGIADDKWMLFLWGFQEISMLNALTVAARKDVRNFKITEESPVLWRATDPETDTRYVVERRDTRPEPNGDYSIRDQTIPVNPFRKKMPKPGTLFS